MDKMDRDGKTQDFIDVALIMHCQNSSWIMGLRIYGEGRTQIPLSSAATIGHLARIQDRKCERRLKEGCKTYTEKKTSNQN